MALKRVTMQEIADACGLSRNTVSKVFNGRGTVQEATRNLVITTARRLGYYTFAAEGTTDGKGGGNIALLTQHKLLSHNFGSVFLTSFTDQISRLGYTMQMYEVSPEELVQRRLPSFLDLETTAGFLGIELFDRDYIGMVCSLGIPTVFVDAFPHANKTLIQCDYVSMENITSETAIVEHAIACGAKRLGFVGDINHCNSFHERWLGFCAALAEADMAPDPKLCILEKDSDLYGKTSWLLEQLEAMPTLPDTFVCANDFLAIRLMTALKTRGLSIPGDVMVLGFGGSVDSTIVEPALTTARIPSTEIGRLAGSILARRIQEPELPFCWTYVKTTPIWGDSTRRLPR